MVVPIKSVVTALFPETDQPVLIDNKLVQAEVSRYQNERVFVSKTNNPIEGETIPVRSTLDNRGMSIPLLVDFTSRIALGWGIELSLFMPIDCA